jgi:hypothetical protein
MTERERTTCSTRKVRYELLDDALRAMDRQLERKLGAYPCKECGGWHLTSRVTDFVEGEHNPIKESTDAK